MPTDLTLRALLAAISSGGVTAVLVTGLYLGLTGAVVTRQELADCHMAREVYLREWIRAISPIGAAAGPPWRDPTAGDSLKPP